MARKQQKWVKNELKAGVKGEKQDEGLIKRFRCATENQKEYWRAIETNTLTFCIGPAGSGKTYVACAYAAEQLCQEKIGKIVIARPLIECGEKLGHLPGSMEEKIGPFILPIFDSFGDMIDGKTLNSYINDGKIEICPLALMRGRTFHNSVIILDEAQNANYIQLKMCLTRMGADSKIVVCGDITQTDLFLPPKEQLHLSKVINKLEGTPNIAVVHLNETDIQRNPLIKVILEKLK